MGQTAPTPATGVLIALLLTLALAGLHLLAPRIRAALSTRERAVGSFAGGLAVSYVFLHLLPELAAGNEGVAEALQNSLEITPLVDLGIFLVALVGFVAFYGSTTLSVVSGLGSVSLPNSAR